MSRRIARRVESIAAPLSRMGLEVMHTIGEASNINVLKGLAGLGLLILDTCQAADAYKEEYETLSRTIYELVMTVVNYIVGQSELTVSQESYLVQLQTVLESTLCRIRPVGKRTLLQRLLTKQEKDIRLLQTSQQDVADAMSRFRMNWQLEIVESVGRQSRQIIQNHQAVMEFMTEIQQEQMAALKLENESRPSTSAVQSHKLPRAPCYFFGREAELSQLTRTCCNETIARVAILGSGGIGKTSLAVRMLHAREVKARFQDRRYFVQCEASSSAEGLLTSMASQLGLFGTQSKLQEKITSFFSARDPDPCLLILDNFETPWDSDDKAAVESLLCSLSDIGNLAIVVTMRGAEKPRGVHWTRPTLAQLRPLDSASSRKLFLVHNDCVPADLAIDELLTKLDHVPLAVTLVGLLAQSSSPRDILAAWEQEDLKLERIERREDSVDVSIRWSLESERVRKAPQAKELLAALALLPDGVNENVLGPMFPHFPKIRTAVSVLLQTSLAYYSNPEGDETGEGMTAFRTIRVLAPIRQYMLRSHEVLPIHRTCLEAYCIALSVSVERLGTSRGAEAIAMLTPEVGNVHSVIGAALQSCLNIKSSPGEDCTSEGGTTGDKDSPEDVRIATVIECASRMARFQRYTFLGSLRTIEYAIAVAKKRCLVKSEGRATFAHGMLLRGMGRRKDATETVKRALEVSTAAGDTYAMADCHHALGMLVFTAGDHSESRKHYDEGLKLAIESKNEHCQAKCIACISEQVGCGGRVSEAKQLTRRALELFHRLDDLTNIGFSTYWLGTLYQMQSAFALAEARFAESIAAFERAGVQRECAHAWIGCGDCRYERGWWKGALAAYGSAREALAKQGVYEDEKGELKGTLAAYVVLGEAQVLMRMERGEGVGRLEEAEEKVKKALIRFDDVQGYGGQRFAHGVVRCWIIMGDAARCRVPPSPCTGVADRAERRRCLEEAQGWYERSLVAMRKKKGGKEHGLGWWAEDGAMCELRLAGVLLELVELYQVAPSIPEVGIDSERRRRTVGKMRYEAQTKAVAAFVMYKALGDAVGQARSIARLGEAFASLALDNAAPMGEGCDAASAIADRGSAEMCTTPLGDPFAGGSSGERFDEEMKAAGACVQVAKAIMESFGVRGELMVC